MPIQKTERLNPDRNLPTERKREILGGVAKKDNKSASEYMKIISHDAGLEKMIASNRSPMVIFYESSAHIVFPPAPYASRRKNRGIVTSITPAWLSEKEYVFHSGQYRGPKTLCSFEIVDVEYGKELLGRMIVIYEKLGEDDRARESQLFLNSLS